MPGPSVHFFATRTPGALTVDPQALIARLTARHLRTKYVREYFLPFQLSADRRADLATQLRARPGTPSTTTSRRSPTFSTSRCGARGFIPSTCACSRLRRPPAFGCSPASRCSSPRGWPRPGIAAGRRPDVRGQHGLHDDRLEILLLLGFQAVYGYVYQQLALLTASFMAAWQSEAGWRCACGVARVSRRCNVWRPRRPLSFAWQCRTLRRSCSRCCRCYAERWAATSPSGEPHFDRARARHAVCSRPGGGCVGAILFSAWLIPVFGFFRTSLLIAVVDLPPAIAAWRDRRRPAP